MSIEFISNSNLHNNLTKLKTKQDTIKKEGESKKLSSSTDSAVVYEKAKKTENTYSSKPDRFKMQSMISQAERQSKNFEKLVSSIFKKQSNKIDLVRKVQNNDLKGFFSSLNVDMATAMKAKQDISENGYYGVKKTSERILSFAKAVAGDDSKELEKMRNAVEKGFKEAERMWGGKLPDICKETYDTVMNKFDEWQYS